MEEQIKIAWDQITCQSKNTMPGTNYYDRKKMSGTNCRIQIDGKKYFRTLTFRETFPIFFTNVESKRI